jgi:hypothetical protein
VDFKLILNDFVAIYLEPEKMSFAETLAGAHPYLNATLERMNMLDQQLNDISIGFGLFELSGSLGLQVDQFKYVICLLLAFPLALIHR